MAKHKASLIAANEYKPTLYLPISKDDVKALELGEGMTVVLKGKITSIRLGAERITSDGKKEKEKPEVTIEINDYEFKEPNVFADLAED